MHRTVEATVDESGNIKLLEPLDLRRSQRVLVTVLDEDEENMNGIPVTALLAEPALSDWNRPEEDEAWKDLQPEK